MDIYLPIAELPVNALLLLALGAAAGVLSGMFGVGGGFLLTPMLIFIGIPADVAVSSSANQIIASSFSGFMAHSKRQNVDFRMGFVLLVGGAVGSTLGVELFAALKETGHIELVISLCFILFLGSIGTMMAIESGKAVFRKAEAPAQPRARRLRFYRLIRRLPLQTHFPRSDITLSLLLPLGLGGFAGVLVSLMGIGGGFIMIPAMIYLLRMPTSVVVGTSLFQIIFITANVTLLQAVQTQTVDIVLALLLLSGSVIGAQFGTRFGTRLPAEYLRGLLALLVMSVAIKMAYNLFVEPDNVFSFTVMQ